MSSFPNRSHKTCLVLILTTALVSAVNSEEPIPKSISPLNGYAISPFSIPIDAETVYLIDLNADQRQDLILEFQDELRVVFQNPEGFSISKYQSIPLPEHSAMWDVARTDKSGTGLSVLVMASDSVLSIWRLSGSSYKKVEVTVPIPSLHLPQDTIRSRFCVDINGDSIDDLALPTTHFLYVFELSDSHRLVSTSKIPLLSSSSATLAADDFSGRVGQRYQASSAVFRDLDNDSHMDAVMQNDSSVRISLGNASEDSHFSPIPDYDISFEKDSRKINFDSIDFSNLFSLIKFAPNRVQIKDLNLDQLVDLTILEPNRVLLYIADESGIDTDKPSQVMRFNENTFILDIFDANEDGMLDLIAVKTPHDISVRRALLALVMPTTLRFEFLVFNHADGMYSRRPDGRILANIKVPALLPTVVRAAAVEVRQQRVEASIRLDLLGSDTEPPMPILDVQLDSEEPRDVLAIQSSEVRVFFNVIGDGSIFEERSELDEVRRLLKARRELTLDVGKMMLATNIESMTHLDLTEDLEPVVIHRMTSNPDFHDLLRFKLNDDELDDIMVFEDRTEKAITGVVLLSQSQR
ncbi:MAG: hypothetical protein OXG24_13200 [Gammaproteobacteria bacterium]|nr:hypothetical protein [Gammaproteobacteria bacterium]